LKKKKTKKQKKKINNPKNKKKRKIQAAKARQLLHCTVPDVGHFALGHLPSLPLVRSNPAPCTHTCAAARIGANRRSGASSL